MPRLHSPEPEETQKTTPDPPSALKLHRLGWNGGEASLEILGDHVHRHQGFPGWARMNAVTTSYDVETYVIDRLGELSRDYDIDAIVAAIRATEWWPVPDRSTTILEGIPEISAIIERHDLRLGDG